VPIVESLAEIGRILASAKTVAVLGMKTEAQANEPAFYVPRYAEKAGLKIIPVPVYYPDVVEILGHRVHRTLASIEDPVDIVDVFRRPKDIPAHVDDILAKMPKVVWFQSGIRNDEVAKILSDKGITVVQDRCLMVELERIGR
jgi:predicted CoA-binding protein